MARRIKPATERESRSVELGYVRLLEARDLFRAAKCPKTLARIRLALSSAKGAQRHMRHRANRTAGLYGAPTGA